MPSISRPMRSMVPASVSIRNSIRYVKQGSSFRSGSKLAALFGAVAMLLLTCELPAQQPLQVLHHHVRPAVTNGQTALVGPVPATQRMQISIVLPLRNQTALTGLLNRIYDPSSPDYRHFLSVEQFTEQFSPTADDYQAVVDFARTNGFTVTGKPANRMVVPISGTVDQINRAFNLSMKLYRHPTENRPFFSPDREPTVNLSVPVAHIAGLNNYSMPRPTVAKSTAAQGLSNTPAVGSGPGGVYLSSDMRAAYYGGTSLTGSGQAVGLVEFDGYQINDVVGGFDGMATSSVNGSDYVLAYTPNAGGTTYSISVNNVLLDGATGAPLSGSDIEETLDIVQAIGMAPGLSQVRIYIGNNDVDVLNAIASENVVQQLSISWVWSPDDPSTDDYFFEEFAAQGQSVFAASGDNGAYDPKIVEYYPAEDGWVTAVGGTDLVTNGAGGAWSSETAWDQSGGGISPDGIPIPSWQAGVANSSNGGSTTLRNVPDVAAEANTDNLACNMGTCAGYWGGTSFAAPRWAGFMALVNQQVEAAGNSTVGLINPVVYAIGEGSSYSSDFRDIVSGNNEYFSGNPFFYAVPGYDLVTGWGSPNGQDLIDALAPLATEGFQLSASPSSLIIPLGTAATTTITVHDVGGFTGSVTLAVVSTLPSGVTASFPVNPATGSSTLTLTASSTAATGTFSVIITGTSGALTSSTALFLTIDLAQGIASSNTNFGTVNVGTASAVSVLNFTFSTAETLGSTAVLTQGATGLDFTNAGTGSCAANTAYAVGQSCTVNVIFTPRLAGTRYGAVNLLDGSGNVIATSYVQGTGVGRQLNFLPGTQSVVANAASNGLDNPEGVAVDSSGNVYIADTENSRVLKETLSAGGYTQSIVANYYNNGLYYCQGVAVDGSGNVYIADTYNGRVLKETPSTGSYTQSVVASFPNNDLLSPNGVAVDGSGNVYIADIFNSLVLKETLSAGSYIQSVVANSATNGLAGPWGVAVDGNGNVYIADTDNYRVLKETLSAGSYTQSVVANSATNGLFFSKGVAVDGSGNVYIADAGTQRVLKEDFVDPPSLTFATTAVGATSTDSPQTVTVENVGNATLDFPVPANGSNPSIAANFGLNSNGATACPLVEAGSSTMGTLVAGASCQLAVSFVPTTAGTLSGSLVLTDTNLNAAPSNYATQSFSLQGMGFQVAQTITFPAIAATEDATTSFTLLAKASSGLSVSFASTTPTVCTVSGTTASLLIYGTCTIQASQAGNANYSAATTVSQSFLVHHETQTITFPVIPATSLSAGSVTLSATDSSGLAVTYTSSTLSICSVSGSTVTLLALGNCSIEANQAGNASYSPAAQVGHTFAVTLTPQTITFPTISTQTVGTPLTLSATASSGLAVSFLSTTTSICTVSGTTATFIASGTCTIDANQPGNSTYAAAPAVSQTFAVTLIPQSITFTALPAVTYTPVPFAVSATVSSGLVVSFASTTPTVCMVSGSLVTLVATGSCTIQATQAGNSHYAAAPAVSQSFMVSIASQTITFPAITATEDVTTTLTLSATASSGLAVSFASTTPTVCTVSGTTASLLIYGTCTIQASQAGNADYSAATTVSQSFLVHHDAQTISFPAIPAMPLTAGSVTLSATASSGLAVTYTSSTPSICSVSGSMVNLMALGNCSIEANQAGNASYSAAPQVGHTFAVTLAPQTITFAALPAQTYGATPFTVGATASSGLAVSFASTTLSVCTVNTATVTLLATGTCSIKATQAGNTDYLAAPAVTQSFTVNHEPQTITFAALPAMTYGAAPFTVSATASSGLTVSFTSPSSTVCTVSGTTVTLVAAGTCEIVASQAGNSNYVAAPSVAQYFTVHHEGQTITFSTIPSTPLSAGTVSLSAAASSGLAVSFASTTPLVCTVSGTTATLVTSGSCTITASQAGNGGWSPATKTQTFTVTP